ncbi:MAG: hypothetical protein MZV65_42065 [Chromatiales bacterium]|nr:hypothetical protein [Chromatiales bacterium]
MICPPGRESLVVRRLEGGERPEDAAELSLIEADRRALEQMLAEHRAARLGFKTRDQRRHAENWQDHLQRDRGPSPARPGRAGCSNTRSPWPERLVDFNREIRVAPGGLGYRMRVDSAPAGWRPKVRGFGEMNVQATIHTGSGRTPAEHSATGQLGRPVGDAFGGGSGRLESER